MCFRKRFFISLNLNALAFYLILVPRLVDRPLHRLPLQLQDFYGADKQVIWVLNQSWRQYYKRNLDLKRQIFLTGIPPPGLKSEINKKK